MEETWPNFFIVGAPRAGTTSLYQYLRQVPGIYMSPVKEPNYFGTNRDGKKREEYLRLFSGAKGASAVGEASVGYLRAPEAPARIRQRVPGARIVISLRDPVEQVRSHYFEHTRRHITDLSFEEAARMEEHTRDGFYADAVARYLDVFGAGRVKILVFEEFARDPRKTVVEVMRFLGLEGEPPAFAATPYNAYAAPRVRSAAALLRGSLARRVWRALAPEGLRRKVSRRALYKAAPKPPMPEESRVALERLFRADVDRLEKILGRPLPWYHRRGSPGAHES